MDFWLLFDMVRGVSARFRRENGEEGDGCAWFACSILELAGKMGGVWSKEENGRSNGGVWCFLELVFCWRRKVGREGGSWVGFSGFVSSSELRRILGWWQPKKTID